MANKWQNWARIQVSSLLDLCFSSIILQLFIHWTQQNEKKKVNVNERFPQFVKWFWSSIWIRRGQTEGGLRG